MKPNPKHTGTAIAIAWPETLCKQPGSWYDSIMSMLGINNNHYYKVGHAAVVLINHETENAYYYDFGRYHAPFQHGRVRSELTDRELKIKTKVAIKNKDLSNMEELLYELRSNESCHGEGVLVASKAAINFKLAQKSVLAMQTSSPLPYGPFVWNGTNCSRFVNKVLVAGLPSLQKRTLLKMAVSPTPMWNVKSFGKPISINNIGEISADGNTPTLNLQSNHGRI